MITTASYASNGGLTQKAVAGNPETQKKFDKETDISRQTVSSKMMVNQSAEQQLDQKTVTTRTRRTALKRKSNDETSDIGSKKTSCDTSTNEDAVNISFDSKLYTYSKLLVL